MGNEHLERKPPKLTPQETKRIDHTRNVLDERETIERGRVREAFGECLHAMRIFGVSPNVMALVLQLEQDVVRVLREVN